jgi:pSer/pThr/pTyr-binding forkhead associated (FHA) protein
MVAAYCNNCGQPLRSNEFGRCPNCAAHLPTGKGNDPILDKETDPGADTAPGSADLFTDSVFREAVPAPEKLDLLIEYQHEVLNCTEHGCIPLRLTNTGERVIEQIHFKARCDAFPDYTPPKPLRVNLAKGDATRLISLDFSIGPVPGPYLVNIEGVFVDAAQDPHAFRGVFKIIVRNPRAPRAKLTIEDGHGIDVSDNIDLEAVDVIIKDASGIDMSMNANRKKGWLSVRLEADFEKSRLLREWSSKKDAAQRRSKQLRQSFSKPFVPGTRAIIKTVSQDCEKHIMVWTRRECRLGRSPSEADIVCILMPGNKRNNARSLGISRRHSLLTTDGSGVSIADAGSTHGTYVDNRKVTSPHLLSNGQLISLGRLLTLQYRDFRRLSGTREVGQALDECRSVFDCTNALSALNLESLKEQAPLESYRLRRVNNYRDRLEYLFLLTSATIGASAQCALRIEGKTVAEQHARLMMADREIHIMDLNSPSGTRVNGRRLDPYMVHPLGSAATIHVGDVCMTFNVIV